VVGERGMKRLGGGGGRGYASFLSLEKNLEC